MNKLPEVSQANASSENGKDLVDEVATIGEHAKPPPSIEQLKTYVTHVSSIPTIPPGSPLEHAGPTTPVAGVDNLPGAIQVANKALTEMEKLSLSDSKLWMKLTNQAIGRLDKNK